MSFERPEVVFYDSTKKNFRDALVDLTQLAYFIAIEDKILQEEPDIRSTFIVKELETDKVELRTEYSFYTEGDNLVEIQSIASTRIDDLTDEAAQLIYDDMHEPNARGGLTYELDEIQRAEIEHFIRRSYSVELATGNICVKIDTGYLLDSLEITRPLEEVMPEWLDMEREHVFEIDDFREFMQALYTLGLVDDTQIRQFLDKPF